MSWRDIPASVEAEDAAGQVTRQLSDRFQALIDAVAMQLGLAESDAYLDEWRRSEPAERAGTAGEVAAAVAAELEERFPTYAARAFRPIV
ncbi:MAG: virulence factor [Candidatus Rokubacteria bacterium]|nr:virulence factor [Candidatus Rokubacteria bacterium]